jgi:hypothetical protein
MQKVVELLWHSCDWMVLHDLGRRRLITIRHCDSTGPATLSCAQELNLHEFKTLRCTLHCYMQKHPTILQRGAVSILLTTALQRALETSPLARALSADCWSKVCKSNFTKVQVCQGTHKAASPSTTRQTYNLATVARASQAVKTAREAWSPASPMTGGSLAVTQAGRCTSCSEYIARL